MKAVTCAHFRIAAPDLAQPPIAHPDGAASNQYASCDFYLSIGKHPGPYAPWTAEISASRGRKLKTTAMGESFARPITKRRSP